MLDKPIPLAAVFGAICLLSVLCPAARSQASPPEQEFQPGTVLHVETREAVIDVMARDRHNLPIANLTASEFQVYEIPAHGGKIPRQILSLNIVDPEHETQEKDPASGFRLSSGAVCALNATVHYRLAISASSQPGYHDVLVKTTRPHVNLVFRQRYYVGFTRENATTKELKKLVTPEALEEAACYRPLTPLTLTISARVLDAAGGKTTRYAAVIKPESLNQIGINRTEITGAPLRLQLDFGMCLFDAEGEVAGYLHSSMDRQLDDADLALLQGHGLVSFLDVPGKEPPALARLAVLDRNTGSLGAVDVVRPPSLGAPTAKVKKQPRLTGDIRAFGSVTPAENSFCGDVYELPLGSNSVSDLGRLEPVASLYINTLDVPVQNITQMGGIPGVTHSSLWFGIDYYAKFYVTKPGEYVFELESDDGSRLEIDDRILIDLDGVHAATKVPGKITLAAGWHSIHVPYFQGPPSSLALVLSVRPPGETMHPFNLGEFVPPVAKNASH